MSSIRRIVAVLSIAVTTGGCADSGPMGTLYTGTFSGPYTETFTKDGQTCVVNFTLSGTVSIRLSSPMGAVSGEGTVKGTETAGAVTGANICQPQAVNRDIDFDGLLTGTTANLQFAGSRTVSSPVFVKNSVSFSGSLSGGIIAGVLTVSRTQGPHASGMTGVATATLNVTLQ